MMDQPSCIKWKREQNSLENIPVYADVEPNKPGPALSGLGQIQSGKKSFCRAAAVILGLLCLLLLTGLIIMVVLYIKHSSKWEMEMLQLQTGYKNLTEEKDQLQTNYRNLTEEQNQLQKRFEDMTNKRNALYSQGWISFSGSFYKISSIRKSWTESRTDCLQKGADLVIINNRQEQEFTTSLKQLIWIGLTDKETEGKWKWVDGTPLTTSYWAPHEPNGQQDREEDCAEIKNYDLVNSWNDASCNVKNFWICEKKLL